MNYSDLSDFQINKLVAGALGIKVAENQFFYLGYRDESVVIVSRYSEADAVVDYCNNPSDAGPIILKNKISINCYKEGDSDYWESSSYDSKNNEKKRHFANDDKNPLRAAMIVYLMMKDAENEV